MSASDTRDQHFGQPLSSTSRERTCSTSTAARVRPVQSHCPLPHRQGALPKTLITDLRDADYVPVLGWLRGLLRRARAKHRHLCGQHPPGRRHRLRNPLGRGALHWRPARRIGNEHHFQEREKQNIEVLVRARCAPYRHQLPSLFQHLRQRVSGPRWAVRGDPRHRGDPVPPPVLLPDHVRRGDRLSGAQDQVAVDDIAVYVARSMRRAASGDASAPPPRTSVDTGLAVTVVSALCRPGAASFNVLFARALTSSVAGHVTSQQLR